MEIYYRFASVHDRVIVWWTRHDGVNQEKWLSGLVAVEITKAAESYDNSMQRLLQRAVSETEAATARTVTKPKPDKCAGIKEATVSWLKRSEIDVVLALQCYRLAEDFIGKRGAEEEIQDLAGEILDSIESWAKKAGFVM